MSRFNVGIISGLIFGAAVVGLMMPMQFPDKKAALIAAFINRFSVGFVLGSIQLPFPPWLSGLVIALLLSLPDAIITKAYAPILGVGSIGGIIIGIVVSKF